MDPVNTCLDYITEVINSKNQAMHTPDFLSFVNYFSQILQKKKLELVVNGIPQGHFCLYCDTYIRGEHKSQSIGLWCAPYDHLFCSAECLQKHVLTSGQDMYSATCPYCRSRINPEQLMPYMNHRAVPELVLTEDDIAFMKARFECKICFSECFVEEGITLDCNHRFCHNCIKQYVSMLVESAQVSQDKLKCPEDTCTQPLTVYEIEHLISPQEYAKYERFSLTGLQIESEDEVLVRCPTANCEFICILDKTANRCTCSFCNTTFCPKCSEDEHVGMNCEDFRKWKVENNLADQKLQEIITTEGLLKCPKCGIVIERTSGCRFIVCTSNICQRKTFFCYACGMLLDKNHQKHECDVNKRETELKQEADIPQRRVQRQQPLPRNRRRVIDLFRGL